MTFTTESNIVDIATAFNRLNGSAIDVKVLAKRGKAKLIARIEELEAAQPAPKKGPALNPDAFKAKAEKPAVAKAEKPAVTKPEKPEPKVKAEKPEPKVKGPVIRAVAESLLLEVVTHDDEKRPYGHAYDTVLASIHEQFPGAKTTVACLRWYAVHMRERGERVPNRPRAPIAKKVD